MTRYESGKEYSLGAIQAIQRCTRRTLYNWIHDGILVRRVDRGRETVLRVCLAAYKVGQAWRVMGAEMNAFIAELNREAA